MTAEAPPVITSVVANCCFKSTYTVELAGIEVAVCKAVGVPEVPNARVKVAVAAAVFVTTMLETTVEVEAGTV